MLPPLLLRVRPSVPNDAEIWDTDTNRGTLITSGRVSQQQPAVEMGLGDANKSA